VSGQFINTGTTPGGNLSLSNVNNEGNFILRNRSGNGGSLNFDNTSFQSLSINSAALSYTGDTNVEFWIKLAGSQVMGAALINWILQVGTPFNCEITTSGTQDITLLPYTAVPVMATLPNNTWAYVCYGVFTQGVRLYINGARQTLSDTTQPLSFSNSMFAMANSDSGNTVGGRLTNLRVCNSDIYGLVSAPDTMPVPTSPLTNVAGTLLLMDMFSAETAIDDTSGNAASISNNNGATWVADTPYN